jgi:hypothetical protein
MDGAAKDAVALKNSTVQITSAKRRGIVMDSLGDGSNDGVYRRSHLWKAPFIFIKRFIATNCFGTGPKIRIGQLISGLFKLIACKFLQMHSV